jgi:hypothetical protein
MACAATESWMMQIARNLVNPWTGFLTSSRLLIQDCATVFSEYFFYKACCSVSASSSGVNAIGFAFMLLA